VSDPAEERFLELVLADPTVATILARAPELGLGDWWLTAGVLFQTVWNALTGRAPGTGIRDADLFYFDDDTSYDAEDDVIRRGAGLFAELPVPVEIRNEARVHLWYAEHFGVPVQPCSVGAASGPARPGHRSGGAGQGPGAGSDTDPVRAHECLPVCLFPRRCCADGMGSRAHAYA